ncbi:MAG: GNAT family N-acetyltransferase [Chloroflexota bacterium]|nr:GNAT family N-acetyltransferase [Anaerolineales bacterium]
MLQIDSIATRPVLPENDDFIYEVYASTRAEEMALTPWTEEQKDAFVQMQFKIRDQQYRAGYPDAVTEIILCNDIPAGTTITLRTADEIRLVDIALLPKFRGAGIGTTIFQRLQTEGKRISLHVLKQNPAVHLYSRLGFVSVTEDSMYLQMEWSPQ